VTARQIDHLIGTAPIATIGPYRPLRWLCRAAPLGHRLFPVLRTFLPDRGLIAVPFGELHGLCPSTWVTPYTAANLFLGDRAFPERPLYHRVIAAAGPGTIVDVGANLGGYVLLTRQVTQARIVAYEPSPLAAGILRRAVALNHFQSVEVRTLACGARPGPMTIQEGINSFVGSGGPADGRECEEFDEFCRGTRAGFSRVDVTEVTLDDDLADESHIAAIKVDCEGYEYQVLLGARRILAEQRPHIFLELHPQFIRTFGSSGKDVIELLRAASYDLECWSFKTGRPRTRLGRVLAGYGSVAGHRYGDDNEMLADAERDALQQVYVVATPR
jgi:FkbM family methyltransferase